LWYPLEIEEQAHIRRLTKQAATGIRADLEADLRTRLLAQVRLAEHRGWDEPGTLLSSLEWTLNCQLFLDHYPSDLTLQWLDPEYRVTWILNRDGQLGNHQVNPAGDPPPTVRQTVAGGQSGRAVISPAFRLPDGSTALQVVAPVVRHGLPIGFLVGTLDARAMLAMMLSDHDGLGYSVSVREGMGEVYRTPGAAAANGNAWAEEVELALPGVAWRISVWPDAALLFDMRSWMPELAGVLGGLLGSALLLALHFGRAAQSRSGELRQARDLLDVRVRQRTAELQQANEHLEAQIAERIRAEDSLQHLSGRLLRLQDEERQRISRELHDSTTQMLGAVAINVGQAQRLAEEVRDPKLTSLLRDSMQFLDQVTTEIRTVSYLLHPPVLDELGLEYVLPWYVDGFSKRSGISVDLDIQPDLGRLPQEVEITLFRITQEALTNVHRHSGSPTASITLFRDGGVATLEIEDQGCGVPRVVLEPTRETIANLGVGIAGMRERVRQLGGDLEIAGSPHGTTIRAVLPLSARPAVAG
jgi:signal transduction histidine kinase